MSFQGHLFLSTLHQHGKAYFSMLQNWLSDQHKILLKRMISINYNCRGVATLQILQSYH